MRDTVDFDGFVNGRYQALVRSAFLLVGDRGKAEDLVQASLMRTYRAGERVQNLEAFTRTVMARLAIRWSRRRWRAEQPLTLPEVGLPERGYEKVELGDAVLRALAGLDSRQRAVIVLRYWDQRSEAEIAEILGCSPGTVKSRAARGIAALRASGLLAERDEVVSAEDTDE